MKPRQKYKIVFLMDPYTTLNLDTETSLLLMDELIQSGHDVFWLEMDELCLQHALLKGNVQAVHSIDPFCLGSKNNMGLDNVDVVIIRKDPPFNTTYLHLTYLLDFLNPQVIQINSAAKLREINEKLFGLNWPEFMPPTITTMNPQALGQFLDKYGKIVVKPLDDCSGRGIELIDAQQDSVNDKINSLIFDSNGLHRFVTAQKFLDAVKYGDKRVYLVDGHPVGMVNRIPAQNGFLGNIHQGATCEKTTLTDKEQKIIDVVGPIFRDNGLFLVGLDLIDEKITEINLTSPSAIRQINEVSGTQIEKQIVRSMLNYIHKFKNRKQMEYNGLIDNKSSRSPVSRLLSCHTPVINSIIDRF